jgi:hypothetical protein
VWSQRPAAQRRPGGPAYSCCGQLLRSGDRQGLSGVRGRSPERFELLLKLRLRLAQPFAPHNKLPPNRCCNGSEVGGVCHGLEVPISRAPLERNLRPVQRLAVRGAQRNVCAPCDVEDATASKLHKVRQAGACVHWEALPLRTPSSTHMDPGPGRSSRGRRDCSNAGESTRQLFLIAVASCPLVDKSSSCHAQRMPHSCGRK